ncbi:MAG: branched-chain amino acid ABC transporter permease [Betaproteobacteria bacterium]|nr:branched-chain amino acid ABC transporter permease [Pseudomonadota bacterium]NBO03628.1 branched-chain amino acid ABC transporter permease [Betaproteobacteria bacterium]NBO94831.1 branched-chain amino acid ABC transporter permease [Betaproteobacteria bacterium]NBP35316.1 branched-chain amino acid ABC transporter permease [Betaproteobacteria bacterium]NBP38425.1 branched-chain amino acid ABC transporter permease [Betaproteobacteria bacterium]
MNLDIVILLAQDGLTNGAIYALLALALVMVFAVTRVIFVPQGEFVAFGALTLASLQANKFPGTVWLLLIAGIICFLLDWHYQRRLGDGLGRRLRWSLLWQLVFPLILVIALWMAQASSFKFSNLPLIAQLLLALLIVVPLGPMIYRLAFQPMAQAPVLVLLIVSVAVHLVLVGIGLVFFGAEGSRTPPFSEGALTLAGVPVNAQTLWVLGTSILLMIGLGLFFEKSLFGKALRATAVNQTGARLMGIAPVFAGRLVFLLAALIGTYSGMLIGPITTIYYDTGFLIGLKGFVGAIIAGLVSYPLAVAGALLVGLLEAYASFWASSFKEVIVFSLIIPVLLWRSLRHQDLHDEA